MQRVDKHQSLSLWSEQISCRWSVRSVKCVVSSGVLIIGIGTVRATQRLFPLILPHAHTSVHCLLLPLSLHGSAHTLSCLFRYCSFANTEFAGAVWSTFLSYFWHQGRPDRYWRPGQANYMAPHSIRYSTNLFGLRQGRHTFLNTRAHISGSFGRPKFTRTTFPIIPVTS
jgi:hypothetical protein